MTLKGIYSVTFVARLCSGCFKTSKFKINKYLYAIVDEAIPKHSELSVAIKLQNLKLKYLYYL